MDNTWAMCGYVQHVWTSMKIIYPEAVLVFHLFSKVTNKNGDSDKNIK